MEKQYLYNKIKGTLVAAGMGDAMGAPSEMKLLKTMGDQLLILWIQV